MGILNAHEHYLQIARPAALGSQKIQRVDALEFLTGEEYLAEDLTPLQSVVIKTIYGLWTVHPPTPDEKKLLIILKEKWGITVDIESPLPKTTIVMILGRRSGKSTLASFIATYDLYSLICDGNPQKRYGLLERYPIHIMHVAAKADQAADVFTLSKDNVRKVKFFEKFIDFDKDTTTELRFFSPHDLALNEVIRQHNSGLPRGVTKKSCRPGSLFIESITTSAATNRRKGIYTLLLSEFAHFARAKMDEEDVGVVAENQQTDYAILKALSPSVRDFGESGKIIIETSPAEKAGEAYREYCIGGGLEQEARDLSRVPSAYQVFQFASWEVSPVIKSREELEDAFTKDPVGSEMEYGAHFSNPSAAFISQDIIESVPVPGRRLLRTNPTKQHFIIAVDPGGKAKKKKGDTYAVAWGHCEGEFYLIDGMHGFDGKIVTLEGGRHEIIPVNPNDVIGFIVKLVSSLGGRNFIWEIAFDQFDSTAPVAILQNLGLPAIETTFTNSYKREMYGDFLQKMSQGKVKMYGEDLEGYVDRWKMEMKYLQRDTSGLTVYYHHPLSGPVQHDDFADVTANVVHRLCLRMTPTKESIAEARKYGTGPIQIVKTVLPVKGPLLWGSRRPPGSPPANLRDRIRGK